ncbi:MAG: hypothetical protein RSB52_03125 [Acidaminococcaceae bacterium]
MDKIIDKSADKEDNSINLKLQVKSDDWEEIQVANKQRADGWWKSAACPRRVNHP